MAIFDSVKNAVSNGFSNFGFRGFTPIVALLVFVVILFIVIRLFGNRFVPAGWEMNPLKRMGFFGAGGRLASGRQMAKQLRLDARKSFKLGRKAKRGAGKSRLGKLTGRIAKGLFREEGVAISEEARLMDEMAGAWDISKLIEKLGNGEIKDHEYRLALDTRIRQEIISLQSMAETMETQGLSEQTKKLVLEIGEQLTTALVQLASTEKFEVEIRKHAFEAAREWVEICAKISDRAFAAETKAKQWEKRLTRNFKKQINQLIRDLNEAKVEEEYLAAKMEGRKKTEWYIAADPSNANRVIETHKAAISNIEQLISSLELLLSQSARMVSTIKGILRDLSDVQLQFNAAKTAQKQLQVHEKEVDEDCENLKKYAAAIQVRFAAMRDRPVEDIVLQLTADCSAIFQAMINMMNKVSNIDNKILLVQVDELQKAAESAFRAEEATRMAEDYFEKIIEAYESFSKLVESANLAGLSKEQIRPEFLEKEIALEEAEEGVAKREEGIAEEVKDFIIKTRNELGASKNTIIRHIETLHNLIELTVGTKQFVLDSLERIINALHQVRANMDKNFQQAAAQFQEQFKQARNAQTFERIAA